LEIAILASKTLKNASGKVGHFGRPQILNYKLKSMGLLNGVTADDIYHRVAIYRDVGEKN